MLSADRSVNRLMQILSGFFQEFKYRTENNVTVSEQLN